MEEEWEVEPERISITDGPLKVMPSYLASSQADAPSSLPTIQLTTMFTGLFFCLGSHG